MPPMKISDLMKLAALGAAAGTLMIATIKVRRKKNRLDAIVIALSALSALFVFGIPWQIEREAKALAEEVDRGLGFSAYMYYDFRGERMYPDEKSDDYNFIRQAVAISQPFQPQTRETPVGDYRQVVQAGERFQLNGKECRKTLEIQLYPSGATNGNFTTWCKEDGGIWHRWRDEPPDSNVPVRSFRSGPGVDFSRLRLPPGFRFPSTPLPDAGQPP